MDSIPVKQIITHTYPDIDAMMAVLLFRMYGEAQFPGASNAEIKFVSAGKLPGGKTAAELEREGIMAIDIGGGRFDTHPDGTRVDEAKLDRCATDLVAEALNVIDDHRWKAIIEYTRLQDSSGQSLHSTDFVHHFTSLPMIITSFQALYGDDSGKLLQEGQRLLTSLSYFEEKKAEGADLSFVPGLIEELLARYFSNESIDVENPAEHEEQLVSCFRRLKNEAEQPFSTHPMDEIISLPALVAGLWYLHKEDKEHVWGELNQCFNALIAREKEWYKALGDIEKKAKVKTHRHARVLAIESENGLVIKAARFKVRADLIIYRDPATKATSFLLSRKGALSKFSLKKLAGKVRIAESIEKKEKPDFANVEAFGTVHDWFLHQSGNLLICGSKKAPDFVPSQLKLSTLQQLAISEIDWKKKIPYPYCPPDHCTGERCHFHRFQYASCKNHRKKTHKKDATFSLRDKFPASFLEQLDKDDED